MFFAPADFCDDLAIYTSTKGRVFTLQVSRRSGGDEELTAVGIFGLMDPLRPGIIESIAKVKVAGITTIMCTGDNIDTAIAISKDAGILEEDQ